MTDDLCTALQFAAALLSEAPEFPEGPRDAAAIEALAAAIADGRVVIPADVLADIRAAMERPRGAATARAAVALLEALERPTRR